MSTVEFGVGLAPASGGSCEYYDRVWEDLRRISRTGAAV